MADVRELGKRAKAAKPALGRAGAAQRGRALLEIAGVLEREGELILAANRRDVAAAEKAGISPALIDRLRLTEQRVKDMADSVRQVAAMPDPVGTVLGGSCLPNGLRLEKVRVPLGVVGMIYEARPNVTVDAAALCVKSGNVCLLRGGKEALQTNLALAKGMREALERAGLPQDGILFVDNTSRESAAELMKLNEYLDVLVPRGGAGLIRRVVETATVPVIETGTGNCHVYVDAAADLGKALDIAENAKTSRPSVCNAAETVLVHEAVAREFLPRLKERLGRHGVELRGCPRTREILGDWVRPAGEEDFATEFLDYILALRVVGSREEAMAHIARYGTGHSECIVTEDYSAGEAFLQEVDAAAVYVNASTRFTDGGEFGLGTELGISTQKLHARGPMGLEALTSYKYLVRGNGQIR